MRYYEVWVASQRYRADKPLTYAHSDELRKGTLVVVPLQRQRVMGVITAKTAKPSFAVKDILAIVSPKPLPEKTLAFVGWVHDYYPSSLGGLLQAMLPASLIQKPRSVKPSREAPATTKEVLPPLTKEQSTAISTISGTKASSVLLHGETGSGKTRVYMELVSQQLNQGRSCIILTPEIGLTPQLAGTFAAEFGPKVLVTHSMLTPAERRQTWLRILESKEPLVIIGTRSALFSPVSSLGLIVMDEMHDQAYKQEQAPYYQTSRIAAKLASLHGAKLIMGSATPLVADYFTMQEKGMPIVRMESLAINTGRPPKIDIVRIEERQHFSKSPYLSDQLLKSVAKALGNKEQSIIFLNRRGTARIVLCQNCGWQALCPNCDVALTYHGDSHSMRCHICAYNSSAPANCPVCKYADITFKSIGTKYLVEELRKLFPQATVQRFDTDNTKAERLEQHYDNIRLGSVDILVGTQLLGKGLDLPKLSTIGVVLADTGLLIPDYTANEITYQQLTQVIGRVGRGHREGTVIIQSYNPDNPAIQSAVNRKYKPFYEQEIKERRLFGFPPFYFLLKLECVRASQASAEKTSRSLAEELSRKYPGIKLAGPGPAFHERVGGKYRWQIIIKSRQRQRLLDIIKQLPANWAYDIDPSNLL